MLAVEGGVFQPGGFSLSGWSCRWHPVASSRMCICSMGSVLDYFIFDAFSAGFAVLEVFGISTTFLPPVF